MEAWARSQRSVRLRRIQLESWQDPAAQQHGIRRLPQLMLYDGLREVSRDTKEITALLNKAARPPR